MIPSFTPSLQMHVNPAAAEATLLSLSQSPQPYQACKFILGEHKLLIYLSLVPSPLRLRLQLNRK